MSLSAEQKVSRLFKKSLGKGESLTTKQFFEEPLDGRSTIFPSQIWKEADLIPQTAPTLANNATDGVVQYFQLLELQHVGGSGGQSYFAPELVDTIPFNFGDGTYNYVITKNDGTTPISSVQDDWILDTSAGQLTFYNGIPSGVNAANPPKISFYKYIGEKGVGTSGSNITAGQGIVDNNGAFDLNVDSGAFIIDGDQLKLNPTISSPTGVTFSGFGGVKVSRELETRTLNIGDFTNSNLNTSSLAGGQNTITGASYSMGFGNGIRTNGFYEISLGKFNEEYSLANESGEDDTDVIFNVGIGTSDIDRKNALTIFKNGAQKLNARPLSEITNAENGFFALDQNFKPNFFFDGQWNDVSGSGGAVATEPFYQTTTPDALYDGSSDVTNIILLNDPAPESLINVFVNGQRQRVGETTSSDCWFGTATTAKPLDTLTTNDVLVWNATSTGFNLETTDSVDIVFEIASV